MNLKKIIRNFVIVLCVSFFSFLFGYFYNTQQKSNDISQLEEFSENTVVKNGNSDLKTSSNYIIETSNDLNYSQTEQQNISVYESANEGVVNITTEVMGINWFLEPVPIEGASGSGSIIREDGLVLTNTHVIADAAKIFVSLYDGSQYPASLVGTDTENDLAVLKFEPPVTEKLTVIKFGNSENLKVGQRVLAIGNPFGLERTLTDGIVSALGRPIQNDKNIVIKNMIQTDTAINPGNSGGPLLDTKGRMIGINTMIYSTSGSSAGVGFAVPINTAKRVIADIVKYGKVRRGTIDADIVQVSRSLAEYAQLPVSYGLLVSKVERGSNAARADLRAGNKPVRVGFGRYNSIVYVGGDVIIEIANQKIKNLTDYYSVLEDKKPGEKVKIKVLRGNKTIELELILSER